MGAAYSLNVDDCCARRPLVKTDDRIRNRVLITGATGLLGRQVLRAFEEQAWTVRGLSFSRARPKCVKCDVFSEPALSEQFSDFRPDVVVHCVAERRPDRLEADRAYAMRINGDAARLIGDICHKAGAWLMFLSTNYVFDGKAAPYAEDAVPCPVNVYGESKLMGEQAVSESCPDAAIIRVPLLYGPVEYIAETSVTGLLETIRDSSAPQLDNWHERYPTNAEDLARVLEAMAAARDNSIDTVGPSDTSKNYGGIFHWQANERQTKYSMAMAIADIAGIDSSSFANVDTAPRPGQAPRPQFERMHCARLENLLGITNGDGSKYRGDFKSSLRRHLQQFLKDSPGSS